MHAPLDCDDARLALSARRDGATHDAQQLAAHLACCHACAEHERTLARLDAQWHALPVAAPPTDLWQRIEARLPAADARPRPARILLRLAAGVVGFLGAHLAARALEVEPAARPHLLARWLAPEASRTARARLDDAPELRFLRSRLAPAETER